MSDTADAVSLSSSTRQQQLSSINNLLQKSVVANTGYDIGPDYCANPRHSATQQTRNEVLLNPTHLPDEFKTRAFVW